MSDQPVPCCYDVAVADEDVPIKCGQPSTYWAGADRSCGIGLCLKHAKILYGEYPQHSLVHISSKEVDETLAALTEANDALDEKMVLAKGRAHTEQLRQEINNIIQRYGQESELTFCETFGVLEMCKLDFEERIRQCGNQDGPEETKP